MFGANSSSRPVHGERERDLRARDPARDETADDHHHRGSKSKIPFDASHIVVRSYEQLGPDIGYSETIRMRGELTSLANA